MLLTQRGRIGGCEKKKAACEDAESCWYQRVGFSEVSDQVMRGNADLSLADKQKEKKVE